MAEVSNKKNETTAIIVIIIIIALLVLLLAGVFLFIRNIALGELVAMVDDGNTAISQQQGTEDTQTIEPALPTDEEVRMELDSFAQNAAVRGDWIYFGYAERDQVAVTRLSDDGTQIDRTVLEWDSWWPMISVFDVTEEGDFLFLLRAFRDDMEAYYYVKYNVAENRLIYQNISDQLSFDMTTVWITDALFDSAGNLIIHLWDEEVLYVVDDHGNFLARIDLEAFRFSHLFRARDGQVFLLGMDDSFEWALKGIDLDHSTLTAPQYIHESVTWIWNAYSAQIGSSFDLYVDLDEHGFHGYDMETGELTLLFYWEDIGIITDWGDDVLMLENGRVAVIQRHSERDRLWSELIIFTP